jgi:spore germination protein Q
MRKVTYNPMNDNANEQHYYSFPAYRAVIGSQTQGTMPPISQFKNQELPSQFAYPQRPMMPVPPSAPPGAPSQGFQTTPPAPSVPGLLPLEQSFIENILRFNLGKIGTFYMTYENNTQWNAKIFKGRIEAAGRDHIIISDTTTGMRYLLLMVNLDYVTFDEVLNYTSPYQQGNRR